MESSGLKKSVSTANVHKTSHTQDLLELFSSDINFDTPAAAGAGAGAGGAAHDHSDVSETAVPGAESTRLDHSDNSQLSKEVSDLLSDINNLNTDKPDPAPALPSSQPPAADTGDTWAWPSTASFTVSDPPALPTKQRPASVQREKIAR